MSSRANLESDTKQMNDIVAALSQAEIDSAQSTYQRPGTPHIYSELQHLGRMLAFPGLNIGLGEPPGRAEHSLRTEYTTEDPGLYSPKVKYTLLL